MPMDDSDMALNCGLDQQPSTVNDVKEFRKKLRNRQSAQRARDRQKARMRWLEQEVAVLSVRNQALERENNTLRNLLGDGVCDTLLARPPGECTAPVKAMDIVQNNQKEKSNDTIHNCPLNNQHDLPMQNNQNVSRCQQNLRFRGAARNQTQSASNERVAVISPIARPVSRFLPAKSSTKHVESPKIREGRQYATLANEKDLEKTTRHFEEPKDEISRVHDMKNTDRHLMNVFMAEQALFRAGTNQQCDLQLPGNLMTANYYPLLSSAYMPPYLQNMSLANLFPATKLQSFQHGCESPMEGMPNEQSTRITAKKNHSLNASSISVPSKAPDPYHLLPMPSTLELLRSLPLRFRKKTENLVEEDHPSNENDGENRAIKRQKMNSFESECSSQVSSESDMYSSQC